MLLVATDGRSKSSVVGRILRRGTVTNEERKKLFDELLAKKNSGGLKAKDRLAIPPQEIPEQDATARRGNVSEVALGYTEEQARIEALRCLQCKNAPCVEGCPVRIRIRDFVGAVAEGDYRQALEIIKENSLLPAVCGRVCPQEVQCQEKCTVGLSLKDVSKAVSIGRLERFVADRDSSCGEGVPPLRDEAILASFFEGVSPSLPWPGSMGMDQTTPNSSLRSCHSLPSRMFCSMPPWKLSGPWAMT